MRISRKKKPKKPLIPRYNRNQYIKAPEVRVLSSDNENLGVMPTAKAIELAREQEMDLAEINPKAQPPVAKILNFTQFKYQKEKEARKQKAKAHVSELKGIRLSIRISDHDMGIRQIQAEKFLNRGDKVKIEVILRGREHGKKHLAFEAIKKFVDNITQKMDIRYEQEAARQGNKVTAIIAKK